MVSASVRDPFRRGEGKSCASARSSPVDDSENALGGTPNSPDGLQEFQYHHTYFMALTVTLRLYATLQRFPAGEVLFLTQLCTSVAEIDASRNAMLLRTGKI